jgi:hypothetical protein
MIKTTAICDSIGERSPRLHTQLWVAPKFIHQESLRHRAVYIMDFLRSEFDPDFSFSVSSSRAIPTHKLLNEARSPYQMAKPVEWGSAQPGMSPGAEVDDTKRVVDMVDVLRDLNWHDGVMVNRFLTRREAVENLWDLHGEISARIAEAMITYTDVHKSIPNRLIEAHVHVHCGATATYNGWMNFYGLRLDGAADPTLRALAEASWRTWNESEPRVLRSGEWHLPFVDDETWHSYTSMPATPDEVQTMIKVSAGRMARLSYRDFDDAPITVERALAIYERLVGSVPIHASPAEHQATPDDVKEGPATRAAIAGPQFIRTNDWQHPEQAGNLGPGWRQFRKMLPKEAVAPLPAAYVVG